MSPRDKRSSGCGDKSGRGRFGSQARIEAGFLFRRLQRGENLGLPHSRPLPDIGAGCHDLRIVDGTSNWRIVYHVAADAIVILDVCAKKTATTPKHVLTECRKRLAAFEKAGGKKGVARACR